MNFFDLEKFLNGDEKDEKKGKFENKKNKKKRAKAKTPVIRKKGKMMTENKEDLGNILNLLSKNDFDDFAKEDLKSDKKIEKKK